MSRSRQRARARTLPKALPPSTLRGNTSAQPRGFALGDLINNLTAEQQYRGVQGRFNPMPRDPLNASPFGPLSPLVPAALDPGRPDTGRPEARILEYPVAWNIPGNDQRPIPWQVLRGAARYIDIVRRCIEVRKRHIRSLKWTWGVRDQVIQDAYQSDYRRGKDNIAAELRQRWLPEINRLTDFWRKPWRANGLSFGQWVNGVLEEHLVLDAVPVYPRMTYGGDCIGLEIVAGDTIKPLLDWRGARPEPPYPAFQQILYGFPRGEFTATTQRLDTGDDVIPNGYLADQMFYHRENFQPGVPGYGYSAVEQALISARLYLKRQGWMLAEYDDGSTPLTWLTPDANAVVAGEDWNPRQRREWENSLNDELSGQTAARHRIKVAPPGMNPHIMPGIEERYKPEYDLYLLKLLATHFNVTLPELGFTEAKGLGSQGYHEGQEDVQDRIGRRPDVAILAELITDLSTQFLHAPPELEFQFLGLESEDEAAQDQIGENRVKSARLVLNEDRRRQGLPLYNFPEADMPMVMTARGVVFLEGASQQAPPGEMVEPLQAPPQIGGLPAAADFQPDIGRAAQAALLKGKKNKKPAQPGRDGITPTDQLSDDEQTQRTLRDRIITQLEPDYPDWALDWIRYTRWEGPTAVPLDQIDFEGKNSWQASHEPDKVAKFKDFVRQNKIKPIIAVRNPGTDLLQVIDGHHRALAYQELKQPVVAWVGTVNKPTGPWDEMHSAQYEGPADTQASEVHGGGTSKKDKAEEASAYKRWAKRNPNPSRPFQFVYHTIAEAELLKAAAGDQQLPPADGSPNAGPKVPDTRWPGWLMDLAVADWWAPRILRALIEAVGIRRLAAAIGKAFPGRKPGDAPINLRAWLADQGVNLVGPLAKALDGVWSEGYLVGDRSAAAVLGGSLNVDWGGWQPGHAGAARRVLSADGRDVGLRQLLAASNVTIKSVADNRLDEIAAVLADGLEQGKTPADIATALRGVLDDPAWAQMVALTETSRAMAAAAYDRYQANDIRATRWLTAFDQNVCPLCQTNADAGPVPLGSPFPSGDMYPPGHPRCRCAPAPVVGPAIKAAKVSKASVNYRQATGPQRCGTCSMYGDHSCTLVAGRIDPAYVCDRWEPRDVAKFGLFDPAEHPRGYHGWFDTTGPHAKPYAGRHRAGVEIGHHVAHLEEAARQGDHDFGRQYLAQVKGDRLTALARHYQIAGRSSMSVAAKRQAIHGHLFGAGAGPGDQLDQMTVPRLRELARQRGVKVRSKDRKADIIQAIRGGHARGAAAAGPPPRPPRPPLTGQHLAWWQTVHDDTGLDDPIEVHNLTVGSGYPVAHGWAFRVGGVGYLIEHDDKAEAATQVRLLQRFHGTLPAEAAHYQQAYHWLKGRNPADSYWEQRYNTPGFRSAFTAGDGSMYAWGKPMGLAYDELMRHEFGHNVSNGVNALGLSAEGAAWRNAAHGAGSRGQVFDFKPTLGHDMHSVTPNPDPKMAYPNGVTEYGQNAVGEDFAESVMLYLHGQLGTGAFTQGGKTGPVYFRDLWPARAALLDQVFPSVASKQQAEIGRLGR